MAEYIDRTEIFKGCSFIIPERADAVLTVQKLLEHINSIPAADVVEVVRCKDCKYGTQSEASEKYWDCENYGCSQHEDYYCADGERRTND